MKSAKRLRVDVNLDELDRVLDGAVWRTSSYLPEQFAKPFRQRIPQNLF
jgi:hypothetical protein